MGEYGYKMGYNDIEVCCMCMMFRSFVKLNFIKLLHCVFYEAMIML